MFISGHFCQKFSIYSSGIGCLILCKYTKYPSDRLGRSCQILYVIRISSISFEWVFWPFLTILLTIFGRFLAWFLACKTYRSCFFSLTLRIEPKVFVFIFKANLNTYPEKRYPKKGMFLYLPQLLSFLGLISQCVP